ncbi:MAG TPA: FeoA domain-containing protein [Denitromonas sp.]|uniref:FeoA family protein n=1 Tax=Denitromonas sp. TaxID=2734609 RepID=UPI001D37368A|nr:ferrous iron transport protein A [Rhodocyclaceae bacterium]MCP5221134.1 ferrous iron transport protein A [Zoogloeaceae bacterium]HQU88004.1 FeoA domain-containing protein [Denitromonas sp.]HQV15566.1 FeoA domain-containing protein [Denitromonas sp.]
MCALSELQTGQDATVVGLRADHDFVQRLHALGVRIGRSVRIIRRGALNGPLQLRIGTTDIMLRRTEAALIDTTEPAVAKA